MRYIFPLPSDILSCSVLFFAFFTHASIFQDGILPALVIAGAPYFNNQVGAPKDAILPKSPAGRGRYIQPISVKIDRLKQHYNRANPPYRTRSQTEQDALVESEEDSGKEDADSPANDVSPVN